MAQKKSASTKAGAATLIGGSVIALSAAGYLLFGPEGKKHRRDFKSWMIRMRADVLKKMEEAKDLTAPAYQSIVSDVEKQYRTLKNVGSQELAREAAILRKNWHAAKKTIKKATVKSPRRKSSRAK